MGSKNIDSIWHLLDDYLKNKSLTINHCQNLQTVWDALNLSMDTFDEHFAHKAVPQRGRSSVPKDLYLSSNPTYIFPFFTWDHRHLHRLPYYECMTCRRWGIVITMLFFIRKRRCKNMWTTRNHAHVNNMTSLFHSLEFCIRLNDTT